jgi:hypothetical protein
MHQRTAQARSLGATPAATSNGPATAAISTTSATVKSQPAQQTPMADLKLPNQGPATMAHSPLKPRTYVPGPSIKPSATRSAEIQKPATPSLPSPSVYSTSGLTPVHVPSPLFRKETMLQR